MVVDERLVTAIIVLNAALQFLRAYPRWEDDGFLLALDYGCTLYFVVELLLKVGLLGFREYWKSGLNRFDFIVIVAASPHLLTPFFEVTDLALLLLLRSVRLVRLLRLLHFIPGRDRLLANAIQALRASVGLFLALVLYNFVLGLTACYVFRDTGSPYFADPFTSMYSLFKVFTIEGWHEIAESVGLDAPHGVGFIARGFFIFAVLTGGFVGISLANAVFVDRMVADNTNELERLVGRMREEIDSAQARTHEDLARIQETLAAIQAELRERDGP
jgi:voltage-gated sodium channel